MAIHCQIRQVTQKQSFLIEQFPQNKWQIPQKKKKKKVPLNKASSHLFSGVDLLGNVSPFSDDVHSLAELGSEGELLDHELGHSRVK